MVKDDQPPPSMTYQKHGSQKAIDHGGHCYMKDLLPVRVTIWLLLYDFILNIIHF